MKEIFRSSMYKLPDDLDLVISVRPAAAEASFEELNEEFLSSLSKLNRDTMAKGLEGRS